MAERLDIKDSIQVWIDKINAVLDLQNVDGAFVNDDTSWTNTTFELSGGKVRSGTSVLDIPGASLNLPFGTISVVGVDVPGEVLAFHDSGSVPATDFIPLYTVTTNNERITGFEDIRTWAYEDSGAAADAVAEHEAKTDPHPNQEVTTATGTQSLADAIDQRGPVFDDVADLDAATNLQIGQHVRTLGYYTPGDGGGNDYEIVAAGTGTDDGGSFIDLSGSGLQAKGLFLSNEASPYQFGAAGDNTADDTSALQNLLSSEIPVNWASGSYRLTSRLLVSLTRSINWRSAGATILCDSVSNIQDIIRINSQDNDVNISGPLTIDGQSNARRGLFIPNGGTLRPNANIVNLGVKNIYRSDDTVAGGDGIDIRGAWNNVYVERPTISNIIMAEGAGIAESQGVSGITIARDTGKAPLYVSIIHPHIDGVYSEDASYLLDQDGIKIFDDDDSTTSALPTISKALIIGGKIRNCGGRGIKGQSPNIDIIGTSFERDGNEVAVISGTRQAPEIGLQYGGCSVRDIYVRYRNSYPNELVQFSGTRVAGRSHYGNLLDRVQISWDGSGSPNRIVTLSSFESDQTMLRITNVDMHVQGSVLGEEFLRVVADTGDRIYVSISECLLRGVPDSVELVNATGETITVSGGNLSREGGSGTVPLGNINTTTSSYGFLSRVTV